MKGNLYSDQIEFFVVIYYTKYSTLSAHSRQWNYQSKENPERQAFRICNIL